MADQWCSSSSQRRGDGYVSTNKACVLHQLIFQSQQGNTALKTLKLALLLPLSLWECHSYGLYIFHSQGFPDLLAQFSHQWTWNKLLAWKLMIESSKGSNYLLAPKCYWFLLVWFGDQHKNPFWDLCIKPMIGEKNIVNCHCCGLNWAFLIVLPLWRVQEMFTESTELALIHHMSPLGYQRSAIWAGREIAGFHPWGPDSNHQQQWCGSTKLSVLMTSLIWAMNNTC